MEQEIQFLKNALARHRGRRSISVPTNLLSALVHNYDALSKSRALTIEENNALRERLDKLKVYEQRQERYYGRLDSRSR